MDSINLTHEDYTIGYICALEVEFTAARCMLEEEHDDFPVASKNSNTYALRRIKTYNVVITCLPEGTIGTTSAATVAANLLHGYKNIQFGLMVSVGGGAPGLPEEGPHMDIHLGDVVVSTPWNNSGGVIQYDFSIIMDNNQSIRIGYLNAPSSAVMSAVTKLRSNIARGFDIRKHWDDILQNYPDLDHTYPGHDADRLFLADYPHQINGGTCRNCDFSQVVNLQIHKRPKKLIVHYDLIDSTNQLMTSGKKRDEVRQDDQIICFEMEASGLMNDFLYSAIRDICDKLILFIINTAD